MNSDTNKVYYLTMIVYFKYIVSMSLKDDQRKSKTLLVDKRERKLINAKF